MPSRLWWFNADTIVGVAHVAFTEKGLYRIHLPKRLNDCSPAPSNQEAPPPEVARLQFVVLRALERAHTHRADLDEVRFEHLGSPFQRAVWLAIADIAPGSTSTYGALAQGLERPGGARAVGSACGRNPFPLLIPCHRVVGASGIGGFTGDINIKSTLLELD